MNTSDRDTETARHEPDDASSFAGGPSPGGAGRSAGDDPGRAAGSAEPAGLPAVDEIVDELLPEEVDWQRLVRSYPLPALALAAVAGFYLGMRRGPVVVGALSGWASGEMTRRVNEFLGDDVF